MDRARSSTIPNVSSIALAALGTDLANSTTVLNFSGTVRIASGMLLARSSTIPGVSGIALAA